MKRWRVILSVTLGVLCLLSPITAAATDYTEADLRHEGVTLFAPNSTFGQSNGVSGAIAGGDGCLTLALPNITDAAALAKAIDDFIAENGPGGNPFVGLGAQFIEGAARRGINPLVVVGHAKQESGFGTAGIATQGTNNAFGRTAGKNQPQVVISGRAWYKYPTWEDSIDSPEPIEASADQPSLLRSVYLDQGAVSLEQEVHKYAPSGDGNNESAYVASLTDTIQKIVAKAPQSISCGDNSSTTTPVGQVIDGAGPFVWPVPPSDPVSACWNDDRTGQQAGYYHSGLDIGAGMDTPVLAASAGTVTAASQGLPGPGAFDGNGFGRVLVIKDDDGKTWTQYQHLDQALVAVGDHVTIRQKIALSGNTGDTTGPHLHFNINPHDGIIGNAHDGSLNPLDYLPINGQGDGRNMTYQRGSAARPDLVGKWVQCISGTDGWKVVPPPGG